MPNIFTGGADALVEVKGDDWGIGYNIGALYEFTPNTRVGLGYRSRVVHHLSGPAHFTGLPGLSYATALTKLDLPESVSLSAFHQWNSRWAIMADITWTHWSRFDERRTQFINPLLLPDDVKQHRWQDSWRYSLGITYQPTERWKLRAGFAYDDNAVTKRFRSAELPYNDRIWLAVGLGYQLTKATTIDFGYTHQFIPPARVKETIPLAGPYSAELQGQYGESLDILGIQFSYHF